MNDPAQPFSSPEPLERVEIRRLTFGYKNSPIFRDFDLTTVARCTVIRGPSGCGKTTLLKLVNGLFESAAPACVLRPQPTFLVLQSDGLAPWLTGRQNIELFSNELWCKVHRSSLFGQIEPFMDRRVHALSFGQRRAIELVRAIASGHPLLLLDEPLNFLDRKRRASFLEYLSDPTLCPSLVVMTSHYEEGGSMDKSWDALEFIGDPPYSKLARVKA